MSDLRCYMLNQVIGHPKYRPVKAHLSKDGQVALCGHREKQWLPISWKMAEHVQCSDCKDRLNEILDIAPDIVIR